MGMLDLLTLLHSMLAALGSPDLLFVGAGLLGIRRPTLSQVRGVTSSVLQVALAPVTVTARVINSVATVLPPSLEAAVNNVTSLTLVPANSLIDGEMPTRAEAIQMGRGALTVAAVATGVAAYGALTAPAAAGAAATAGAAAASGTSLAAIGSGVSAGVSTAAGAVGVVAGVQALVNGAPQAAPAPQPVYAPQPAPAASGLNTGLLLAGAVLAIKLLL